MAPRGEAGRAEAEGAGLRGKTGLPGPSAPDIPLPASGPTWDPFGVPPPQVPLHFSLSGGSRVFAAVVGLGRRGRAGRLFRRPVPVPVLMGRGAAPAPMASGPPAPMASVSEWSERRPAPAALADRARASLRPHYGLVSHGVQRPREISAPLGSGRQAPAPPLGGSCSHPCKQPCALVSSVRLTALPGDAPSSTGQRPHQGRT